MKLSQAYLFYILLGVLLLSSLGLTIKEGFEKNTAPKTPPGAGAWGGVDPTGPGTPGGEGKVPAGALPGPTGASQGIPKVQVPKGDEDLYVLKSSCL